MPLVGQVAGVHSPAECSTVSGSISSVKCALAFWGCVHKILHILCINSDTFGHQPINISLLFHHLAVGEILQELQIWLSHLSHVALGSEAVGSFHLALGFVNFCAKFCTFTKNLH